MMINLGKRYGEKERKGKKKKKKKKRNIFSKKNRKELQFKLKKLLFTLFTSISFRIFIYI